MIPPKHRTRSTGQISVQEHELSCIFFCSLKGSTMRAVITMSCRINKLHLSPAVAGCILASHQYTLRCRNSEIIQQNNCQLLWILSVFVIPAMNTNLDDHFRVFPRWLYNRVWFEYMCTHTHHTRLYFQTCNLKWPPKLQRKSCGNNLDSFRNKSWNAWRISAY